MVCQNCEKKLAKIVTPDTWKTGSSNTQVGKDRPLNENKLLSKAKFGSFAQYQTKCKLCGDHVTQKDCHYCQRCAFKHGICSMCGVKLHDLRLHRPSEI